MLGKYLDLYGSINEVRKTFTTDSGDLTGDVTFGRTHAIASWKNGTKKTPVRVVMRDGRKAHGAYVNAKMVHLRVPLNRKNRAAG